MSQLKSYTISAGTTEVFNFDVMAPDVLTAIAIARTDWDDHGNSNWTLCGPTDEPRFQVEDEREIPDADTNTYQVSFYVTDCLCAQIRATSPDEARRIAEALRNHQGTYEGVFNVVDSNSTEMDVEEVAS